MKVIFVLFVFLFGTVAIICQSDLEKMVETERAFAALSVAKGAKAAFLENLAGDAILFLPDKVGGVSYWSSISDFGGALSWSPNYADVSSNGLLGFTMGNWRQETVEGGTPAKSGAFLTIWQKGTDGRYKLTVDIGVSHSRPAAFSESLEQPAATPPTSNANNAVADAVTRFFETVSASGIVPAFKAFASADVRALREGQLPIRGRDALMAYEKRRRAVTTINKRTVVFGSADLAYAANAYSATIGGVIEKGNFVQIWKFIGGRWQIVADVFKPVPAQ